MKRVLATALVLAAITPVPGSAQAQAVRLAPAAAQGPAGGAAVAAVPYRINPGDELEIYVWGEERLQRGVRVLPDGTFSFPLVGRVDAAGKLPTDIEAAVSRGLKSQYREQVPQVTVSVRAPAGLQFSVAGKVRSPGSFTPGRYVNLLEALVMAGGPAEFADLGNVVVLRKENGRLASIKVRMTDIMRGNPSPRDLAALPVIASGDSVVVP